MNKQLVAVLVILGIIAIGGGAWWLLRDNDASAPSASQRDVQQDEQADQASDQAAGGTQLAAFTKENVAEHNTEGDCWTIISGKIYDLTSYIPRHPGGDDILRACGTDGTSLFTNRETEDGTKIGNGEPHSSDAQSMLESLYVGDLSEEPAAQPSDPSEAAAQ